MKRARAFVTMDGVVHLSHSRAVSHAEARYGNLLCKLSHELVRVEKYQAMTKWLEENGQRFLELEALRLDKFVEEEDEE